MKRRSFFSLSLMMARLRAPFDLGGILREPLSPLSAKRIGRGGEGLRQVVALAARFQMRGALRLALRQCGLMPPLPEALRARLPPDHALSVLENGWIAERDRSVEVIGLTRDVIQTLNAAGIVPMLIKGMAMVFGGINSESGRRWMVDVDMAVPADRVRESIAALSAVGFYESGTCTGGPHHVAPMVRPQGGGEVELHFDIVIPELQPALPTKDIWDRAVLHHQDGMDYALPCAQDSILLNALHAQDGQDTYRRAMIPFRHLADFARLVAAYGPQVDWQDLADRAGRANRSREFALYLYQADRLFGVAWPLPRPPALSTRMRWWLCVAVCCFPWPFKDGLAIWQEIKRLYTKAGAGLGPFARLAAWTRLTGILIFKCLKRLLGRRGK